MKELKKAIFFLRPRNFSFLIVYPLSWAPHQKLAKLTCLTFQAYWNVRLNCMWNFFIQNKFLGNCINCCVYTGLQSAIFALCVVSKIPYSSGTIHQWRQEFYQHGRSHLFSLSCFLIFLWKGYPCYRDWQWFKHICAHWCNLLLWMISSLLQLSCSLCCVSPKYQAADLQLR